VRPFFVVVAAAFTLAYGLIAWGPWVPPFSSLKREEAVVQSVVVANNFVTTSSFLTTSGQVVNCSYSKTGGCDPALMRSLRDARSRALVWHDGKNVYQLALGERVVLPYERALSGRWLHRAVFVVLLVAWCIRGAMHFGLFRNYPRGV